MVLNFDAMRSLLFALEEQPRDIDINKTVTTSEYLREYSHSDIGYALEKLIESGLVIGKTVKTKDGITFIVDSISVDGHKFLDDIRTNTVWAKVKETIKQGGITGIKTILPYAAKYAFDYLTSHPAP